MGNDIRDDQVREINNSIRAWKLMLAKNEYEKLAARKYILSADQVDEYGGIEDLSTWQQDAATSFYTANSFSMDDFMDITETDLDSFEDPTIWDDADFEPFFLSFSGGGSSYTSNVTKTNISEHYVSKQVTASEYGNNQTGVAFHGGVLGFSFNTGWEHSYTETRKNSRSEESSITYEYTLKDDDEQDFYLVAVVPGQAWMGLYS